jgi:hypothetical protein
MRFGLRLLLIFVGLLAGACDALDDSDSDEAPTAIVVTSTPTAGGDAATATGAESGSGTATSAANGTETGQEPTAQPTSGNEAEATATPAQEADEALAEIEAIEQDVEELRGLELLDDIDEQIIDPQELARRVEDIIADEYSPEQGRIDALTYWLLRLVPDRSLDLYQLQIDLYSEQVAGYYDPETDELVVVSQTGELTPTDKVTMAHEIVHSLQDQHFDLIAIDELGTDSDRGAAITALIEGDATLSMTEYMLNYLDPMELIDLLGESLLAEQDFDVLENAPRYVADGLLFSYEDGQAFATALFDEGGFDAINAALADPPLSTEQILHPEKYIGPDRDEPLDVSNPDLVDDLGGDWEVINGDALGEWDLRIMLEENGVEAQQASAAAAGWGGSWFDIYESGDEAAALLTTRWDSADDASEFAQALFDSFGADAGEGIVWTESDRHYAVVTAGDTVALISGTEEDAVSSILSVVRQSV